MCLISLVTFTVIYNTEELYGKGGNVLDLRIHPDSLLRIRFDDSNDYYIMIRKCTGNFYHPQFYVKHIFVIYLKGIYINSATDKVCTIELTG